MSNHVIHKWQTLSGAIRALRDKLSETQAGMARLLDVSLRTYDRWEAGDSNPRGDILVRLINLCPDEETRSLFRATATEPSESRTKRSFASPLRRNSAADRLRVRFRNSCVEAIRIIYEAAALGSVAADEKLRIYADELNRIASSLARDLVKHC